MGYFMIKDIEGKRKMVSKNAVDSISEGLTNTRILLRTGVIVLTKESFDNVLKQYDSC